MSDLIKPKRMYENFFCMPKEDVTCFLFDSTVISFGNNNLSKDMMPMSIKTFYVSENFPSLEYDENKPPFLLNEPNVFSINADTTTFFSVIAGLGEDTFSEGSINVSQNKITFEVLGINYYCSYTVDTNIDRKYSFSVNWYCFYYLFKFFGKLSGKKTGQLLIEPTEDVYYLTAEDQKVLISCKSKDISKEFVFTSNLVKSQNFKASNDIFKKELSYTGILAKQLIRPCTDIVKVSKSLMIDRLTSDNYTCYLFLQKEVKD